MTFAHIKLSDIVLGPNAEGVVDKSTEEYKDLVKSIMERGVIQPVMVAIRGNQYLLVTGLYRYTASVDALKETIPAQIRNLSDAEIEERQLLVCKHKIETTPADYAIALKRMLKNMSIEELAKKLDKTVQWIKDKIA